MTTEESSPPANADEAGHRGDWRRLPVPRGLRLSRIRETDTAHSEATTTYSAHGLLEVDHLGFETGDRELFTGVSFTARAGSTTFVVGGSGELRSALLGILLGTESPTEGTVLIDGDDLATLTLAELRSTAAITLREPWLTAGTIADNIAFGLADADRSAVVEAAKLAGVDEFTRFWKLGIYTEISEQGPELTLGQRRLVALARAIVRRPRLLLIEEPTSQLPAPEERQVIRAINRVTEHITTVLTTDRLTLAGEGDQIIRFDRGQPEATSPRPTSGPSRPITGGQERPGLRRLGSLPPVRAVTEGRYLGPGLTSTTLLERSALTETWLAWALDRDHLVQVKVPRNRPSSRAARLLLAQEYRRVTSLRHPGLARPIAADLDAPTPLTVYEHVDAPTLASVLSRDVQLPEPAEVMRMGYELARTLCSLHHHGLVHLDLRPQTTVLSPQGTILTDLGMARPIGDRRSTTYRSGQVGTIAPEQLRGEPAVPSMDIFALGVLMHQALTGELSAAYHGTFRDRNQMLSLQPQELGPPRRSRRREAMRWHPAGSARTTGTRRDTTATLTVAGDLSIPVRTFISRLTAPDPCDRPTAEQVMAMMRPSLFPAPAGQPRK
jgi:ABC-type cobalamin/Fe3+-siderophores transport system ATPase subunit